jgi:hypothetical protein
MTKADEVTIVSGLPRSGTSLMMQMLGAGGLPALTDGERCADVSNPKGYYELEAVKRTREDPSWLERAPGHCVKMISMLLYDLPADRFYKIIFMTRAMEEVLASQAAMLKTRNEPMGLDDGTMRKHYEAHLRKLEQWVKDQKQISVLYCNYNDLVRNPREEARRVKEFLGLPLDADRMAASVDPKLHRQRHTKT